MFWLKKTRVLGGLKGTFNALKPQFSSKNQKIDFLKKILPKIFFLYKIKKNLNKI